MHSLRHKGLSGFGLRIAGNTVEKWTKGEESTKKLIESWSRQSWELESESMLPLRAVEIIGASASPHEMSFIMPFLDLESGFTTDKPDFVSSQLLEYFSKLHKKTATGFRSIILREINKRPYSDQKEDILSRLSECPDGYLLGPVHGDMGFANMLIGDHVYLIDFTPRFIASPLVDIATMEMSILSGAAKPWHLDLFREIEGLHGEFKAQKDIVRMTLALSFKSEIQAELFRGIK